jgi:hypothetical protein
VCIHFLYNFCLKCFSFWEEFSEILPQMFIRLHIKYPLFLSDLDKTWIFCQIFERPQISNLMKIRQIGAELFHVDRQTDRHEEASSCFSQFWKSTKTCLPNYMTKKQNKFLRVLFRAFSVIIAIIFQHMHNFSPLYYLCLPTCFGPLQTKMRILVCNLGILWRPDDGPKGPKHVRRYKQ